MSETIREIKGKIRETEKARQEMIERISELQQKLSDEFMAKLKQYPSRYDRPPMDDEVLKTSQNLDTLSMEYLMLEKRLNQMQEKLQEMMEAGP